MRLDLSLALTASASSPPPLSTVATDASASPTTVLATLAAGQTGLRVFTSATPASETYFDLYVSKNGGAVTKVRSYRWQGRILAGVAGDTFALGTTDGRSVSLAPLAFPAALAAPSGVTGTANCDQALPILWSPSAAHVTLPSTGSNLQLNFDGTERWVFISEKAPDNTWTPARWVVLPAAANVIVQCNYTQIALANEAGATLSVTAPTGSTVGGASVAQSLPAFSVTGTVRNVTTAAEFHTAIAAAVAGDDIVLAAGTYALTAALTNSSFTANNSAGNHGMEGIRIRGATSDRTLYIIGGNGTGSNGDWNLTMVGGQTMAVYAYLENVTFDFGVNNIKWNVGGGKWRCTNVKWMGGSAADLCAWDCASYLFTGWMLNCYAGPSADDCWNFNGNATYNSGSRAVLVSCTGISAGNAAGSQCLTSHNGLAVETYGGTFSDAHTNVIANDAGTTPTYMFWSVVTPGTRQAGITNGVTLFGCSITGATALSSIVDARLSRFITANVLRNCLSVERNVISGGAGRGVFNSLGAGVIVGNIITGNEAIRLGNAAGVVASTTVEFNTIYSSATGWNQVDVANMPVVHKNNAYRANTTSVNIPTLGMPVITTDYNTIDPTIDADYTAGANDTTGSDAAMSATTYIPTASGNVDGNGDASVVDYVGDSDPFGLPFIYKASRVSRGARDIPAIYASAVLLPEYY